MGYVYNDVAIQECRTLEFKMEQERDPSGTDSLWNKYTIRVRGFISSSSGTWRSDTSTVLSQLKNALQTPRRPFTYSVGGVTLVSVTNPPDAHIGPEPLPTTVYQVTSGTYMIETGVICRIVECDNSCETRSPVVSLRWTQTESFDENWYSQLTTTGKLIVRSDLLQSADSFRPLATPPILVDYQRTEASYTLSPDGTILDFRFVDKEADRLPPFPATKVSGYFQTEVRKVAQRTGTVHIELEGPKGTSRQALMYRALSMCYSKLQTENIMSGRFPAGSTTPIIMGGSFREDLVSPKVIVEMNALLSPLLGRGGMMSAAASGALLGGAAGAAAAGGGAGGGFASSGPQVMASVGVPPLGMSSGKSGLAPPDRKRLAALLAAAFNDPCACAEAGISLTTRGRTPSTEKRMTSIPPTPTPLPSISISTSITASSSTAVIIDRAPYTSYMMHETTKWDTGLTLMPGTGSGTGSAKTTGAVVTTSGGFAERIVSWVASRAGTPPVLPAFETNDPNVIPMAGSITGKDTVPTADGSLLMYMIAGFYVYAVKNIFGVELRTPTPPFVSSSVDKAAGESMGFWEKSEAALKGTKQANPFEPNGIDTGTTPTAPSGFGTVPSGVDNPLAHGYSDAFISNPDAHYADGDPLFIYKNPNLPGGGGGGDGATGGKGPTPPVGP